MDPNENGPSLCTRAASSFGETPFSLRSAKQTRSAQEVGTSDGPRPSAASSVEEASRLSLTLPPKSQF